eukprot:6484410-Prymnesium_polylepis.1
MCVDRRPSTFVVAGTVTSRQVARAHWFVRGCVGCACTYDTSCVLAELPLSIVASSIVIHHRIIAFHISNVEKPQSVTAVARA